jgi:hypothetical protein
MKGVKNAAAVSAPTVTTAKTQVISQSYYQHEPERSRANLLEIGEILVSLATGPVHLQDWRLLERCLFAHYEDGGQ